MSLDDLFSLLLFALFIGAPLLSRFLRRGGPGPQRPTGKAPSTRPGLPKTPPTQTPQKRDETKSAAETAVDDIGERLEQARRRVREAVEGQTARVDTRPQSPARGATQGPTGLESAGDMFRQPSPERPSATAQTRQTPSVLTTDLSSRRSKRTTTRPLQVERSLTGKRAKLGSATPEFSRKDILRGIMWQQILDAPKSKRPWRNPSQRP